MKEADARAWHAAEKMGAGNSARNTPFREHDERKGRGVRQDTYYRDITGFNSYVPNRSGMKKKKSVAV
jgi:hypothetical protein